MITHIWNLNMVNFAHLLNIVELMLLAYLLALPLGWQQEKTARSAGLRTFPIVALASCGYLLIAHEFFGNNAQAQYEVLCALMTGMGFIGGGAILKGKELVRGTSTAASIWATGAIGAAVAFRAFEVAIVLALVTFLTLFAFTRYEKETE